MTHFEHCGGGHKTQTKIISSFLQKTHNVLRLCFLGARQVFFFSARNDEKKESFVRIKGQLLEIKKEAKKLPFSRISGQKRESIACTAINFKLFCEDHALRPVNRHLIRYLRSLARIVTENYLSTRQVAFD